MALRSRTLKRIRTMVSLALLGASVAACGLLAGLTEDYKVNPDSGPGSTNEAGDVCGVQRIYVGQDGRNIRDWSGRKVKLTNGVLSGNGAVVRLRVR